MPSTALKPALPVSSCLSHSVHGLLAATGTRNETISIRSVHQTMAKRVNDRWESAGWSSIILYNPCSTALLCYPGSPSLTVLHVTTRHFTSLMLLIFSSISSFFTSGWKYCSCSSASACGSTQKKVVGRQRWEKSLHTGPSWSRLQPGSQRNTKYLLLQKNPYSAHAVLQHWNEPPLRCRSWRL